MDEKNNKNDSSQSECVVENDESFNFSSSKVLMRAASICRNVTGVTIGPNSTFINDSIVSNLDETDNSNSSIDVVKSEKSTRKSKSTEIKRRSTNPTEDVMIIQEQLKTKALNRKIEVSVRKEMEKRLEKENERYQELQQKMDQMRLEAERKHNEKTAALEKKIKEAIEMEEREELNYQKHFKEVSNNSRKIIDQENENQLKELKEAIKKYENHFEKLESNLVKIFEICPVEMSMYVDEEKRNLQEIREKRSAMSLGEWKKWCTKLEESCRLLLKMKTRIEEEIRVRRELEEKQRAEKLKAEADKIAEVEAQKAAAAAAAAVATAAVQQKPTKDTENSYLKSVGLLKEKQEKSNSLSSSNDLQTLRFALKIAINGPINHLNKTDKSTLLDGFSKLQALLSGQRVQTTKGQISVADHPEASDWVRLRLAEKFIEQTNDIKEDTFFVLAALIVEIWQTFPEFGEVFIASLYVKCPYLVPYNPPFQKGQSTDEYLKILGYRVDDKTNQLEMYSLYQSRTSRYAGLLAAIWITNARQNKSSPFGIENGWKFLVNILNSQPDSIYLHIIDKTLEIAGPTFQLHYGRQFIKLMKVLNDAYLPALSSKVDEKMTGAYSRLKNVTLKTFFDNSKFAEPKGILPPNYW